MSYDGWKKVIIKDIIEKTIDNRGKNPPTSTYGHEIIETICINNIKKIPDYTGLSLSSVLGRFGGRGTWVYYLCV